MPGADSSAVQSSLPERLAELRAGYREKLPAQTLEVLDAGVSALVEDNRAGKALQVLDEVPDFELPNATGTTVSLSSILENGPVVLVFYRGVWCPYCTVALGAMQAVLPEITELGASLVAVSPMTPDGSLSVKEKEALEFEVLSDAGADVAASLGLAHELGDSELNVLSGFDMEVVEYNGGARRLPIPATYVIDSSRTVRYAFVAEDYTKRADPRDVVTVLEGMKEPPLLDSLAATRERIRTQFLTPKQLEVVDAEIDNLIEQGKSGLAVGFGELAPKFELKNATGKPVSLDSLLAKGPVVLTFYRGVWCPYCVVTVAALQTILPQIKALGASLVAISPQMPDSTVSTVEKGKLEFEVLSDLGGKVADQYGLVFDFSDKFKSVYMEIGVDLEKFNGAGSWRLPMTATYVIDKEGQIQYAFVKEDFTLRSDPAEILGALKKLK